MTAKTIDYSADQRPPTSDELLAMILDNAHIHDCAIRGKSVMTVLLTTKEVDRLSCYGLEMEDLEDGHDVEQEDAA